MGKKEDLEGNEGQGAERRPCLCRRGWAQRHGEKFQSRTLKGGLYQEKLPSSKTAEERVYSFKKALHFLGKQWGVDNGGIKKRGGTSGEKTPQERGISTYTIYLLLRGSGGGSFGKKGKMGTSGKKKKGEN